MLRYLSYSGWILFFLLLVIFLNSSFQEHRSSFSSLVSRVWGNPEVDTLPQIVEPIVVPMTATFAGEKVPLHLMDVKERLDRELLVNTYWHSNTIQHFKLANRYFPTIEKILAREGVPDDFKYLALAESGFRDVVSPSNAVGFWQFLEETAKEYGLEVSKTVDERKDLEKSTLAACKYIKQAYKEFGNWTLAAASFNSGINKIRIRLKQQKANSYYELYLNEETYRYIFRIIALKEIFSHPHTYGFYIWKQDLYSPYPYTTLQTDTSISNLFQFATAHKTSYKALKLCNPWLRDTFLQVKSGQRYRLKIPTDTALVSD